jgi:hypothetical protein
LSYPVVWIAAGAEHAPPLQTALVWGIGLASTGLLAWMVQRTPGVSWFCAGWFVVCIGPVLMTMRPDWLIDAPRFLYPAGVGAALWWGIANSRLAAEQQKERVLAIAIAVIIALPGAVFAYQGVGWHLYGGRAIRDALRVRGQGVHGSLIINLPERLAPQRSIYPYFDGGAILLPPQVEAWEIFRTNQFGPWESTVVSMGAIQAPVPYHLILYGPPLDDELLDTAFQGKQLIGIADYSELPIRTWYAGNRQSRSEYILDDQPVAVFENTVTLWSAGAITWEHNVVTVDLFWEITAAMEDSPTIFVHLVDSEGNIIAQGDGDPVGGLHPLSAWPGSSYFLEDERNIRIPRGVNRDGLIIYVGIWRPPTGEKLPVSGGDFPDDRVPIRVMPRFYY